MSRPLPIGDVRRLAALERDMDAGACPFVWHAGERVAVPASILEELGLVSGQSIGETILRAITERIQLRMTRAVECFEELLAAARGTHTLLSTMVTTGTWAPDFPAICAALEAAIAKSEAA